MNEDDIAYLRSLVPDNFTLPTDLTPEEVLKLHMVSIQRGMDLSRQLEMTLTRVNAYLNRAEATLDQLEKQLEENR